jgi:hypothetical protein
MLLKYNIYVSIGTVYNNYYKNISESSLNLRVGFKMNVNLDSVSQNL